MLERIILKILTIVKNIKNAIIGLLPNKNQLIKITEHLKTICLKYNAKILNLTDKIVAIYNKFIAGKPRAVVDFVKNLIKKVFEYVKKIAIFIRDFYKKDKKRAIIYFVILYVIYKVVFGIFDRICTFFQSHKNEMIVSVRVVEPERVEKNINCYGYIESENNLQYLSEVRGNIDKILVQEKQHVKEGQLLMILDSKFTVNSYISAKSILESKRLQYNAIQSLYLDGLESKGNLKAMQADLESANSNFESAKKAYNGLKIYAPFDGYIDNINNKEGSQINIGTRLFTLERMNAMQVKCDVQNLSTNEVGIGEAVRIFVNGYEVATGKISVIGDSIDVYTGSRTVVVNNIMGNKGFEETIKPGMSVMMKIIAKSQHDVYKISSEALETTETGAFMVKIFDTKSKAISKKNVWIYDEHDGIDYVIGLDNDDYVVERGHEFVNIGEKDIRYTIINTKKENTLKDNLYQIWTTAKKIATETCEFFKNLPEFYQWSKVYYGDEFVKIKKQFIETKDLIVNKFYNKYQTK